MWNDDREEVIQEERTMRKGEEQESRVERRWWGTRKREDAENNRREREEGGRGNQRELSTAGRWQTVTHFKHTHTHTHTFLTTHKHFKHLTASVGAVWALSIQWPSQPGWKESIITHTHTQTDKKRCMGVSQVWHTLVHTEIVDTLKPGVVYCSTVMLRYDDNAAVTPQVKSRVINYYLLVLYNYEFCKYQLLDVQVSTNRCSFSINECFLKLAYKKLGQTHFWVSPLQSSKLGGATSSGVIFSTM